MQSGPLKLIVVEPKDLRLEVDLLDRGSTRPETGQEVVSRLSPNALVCGPMFEIPSHQGYAVYDVARLIYRYLDTRRDINVPGSYPQRGGTISVVGNSAQWMRGDQIQNGSEFAIQGYPSLVENGQNVASAAVNTQVEGRCAIGINSSGKVVFCLATLSMSEFAAAMIRAGVVWASYLDGGSSSVLYGDGFHIGLNARRLPAYIFSQPHTNGVRPEVPGTPGTTKTHPLVYVAPVLAITALMWYLNED